MVEKVILPPAVPTLSTQLAVMTPALPAFTALMISVGVAFWPIEIVLEAPLGKANDNLPAAFAKLVAAPPMKLADCSVPVESLVRLSLVTKVLATLNLKPLVVPVSLLVNKILNGLGLPSLVSTNSAVTPWADPLIALTMPAGEDCPACIGI